MRYQLTKTEVEQIESTLILTLKEVKAVIYLDDQKHEYWKSLKRKGTINPTYIIISSTCKQNYSTQNIEEAIEYFNSIDF